MRVKQGRKLLIATIILLSVEPGSKKFEADTIATFAPKDRAALEDLDAAYYDFLLKIKNRKT